MTERPKVLVLFSGGLDSVVLAQHFVYHGYEVHPFFINYGQANFEQEIESIGYWTKKMGIRENLYLLDIPPLSWSESSSVRGNVGETGNTFKDEYVEMRNLIFLSYALSYAEKKKIGYVSAGFIDAGEDYPDTSPKFTKLFDSLSTVTLGIEFITPFVYFTKEQVVETAEDYEMDLAELFSRTFTCNTPISGDKCGKCFGCFEIEQLKEKFLSKPVD
jgi:7-cyano-7-deazaguanine synthase